MNDTLYINLKQMDYYVNDKKHPQIVLKYTASRKKHEIEKAQLFIKRECILDSEVFNYANMLFELVVQNKTYPIHETELYDIFNNMKKNGKEKMVKQKSRLDVPEEQLWSYPYLYFDLFNKELKEAWFEKQYEKNNVGVVYNQ